jgi:Uma2 family endonuclease
MTALPPLLSKKKLLSFEDYLKKEEKSLSKNEFINGILRTMPGGTYNHNKIALQVGAALLDLVNELEKPYDVCNSDMKIYIPSKNHGLYPDAVVVCEVPEYWNGRTDVIVNPLLVVEVLSSSTEKYDRGDKFMEYKTLPSFKEYVLIQQDKPHVESMYREEPTLWRETIVSDLNEGIFLGSIGGKIDLKKIYRNIQF